MFRPFANNSARVRGAWALSIALGSVALLLSPGGVDAKRNAPKSPKAGKYAGKVGTFARVIFDVRRGFVVSFNAGVKTNCQRASDGTITETKNLATGPSEQQPAARLKVKGKKRRFSGEGQDGNGIAWEVKGRFVSRTKAAGTFEASKFETIFNPFLPFGFDSQLCAGSGSWTATLKRNR